MSLLIHITRARLYDLKLEMITSGDHHLRSLQNDSAQGKAMRVSAKQRLCRLQKLILSEKDTLNIFFFDLLSIKYSVCHFSGLKEKSLY